MTLSNFDWTDKASVRWFILLPEGHKGPYSLDELQALKVLDTIQIWAEGLPGPVAFSLARERSIPEVKKIQENEELLTPPPLPVDPNDHAPSIMPEATLKKATKLPSVLIGIMLVNLFLFIFYQWADSQKKFVIHRQPQMALEVFSRIQEDFKFQGWNKKIFFKEYASADLSRLWLVTASYQSCEIKAQFSSLENKLLTKDEGVKVRFISRGELKDHLVEFSQFDFIEGGKIIPGLYELDLHATNCTWSGTLVRVMNAFHPVEEKYTARMKVVLYHLGGEQFNQALSSILERKQKEKLQLENQEELFWQDIQQKLQTLLAINLQVEQHFLNLVEKGPTSFSKELKASVDHYTRQYGHLLTTLLAANEDDFNRLQKSSLPKWNIKSQYEESIKSAARSIGFEAMKLIEELQLIKNPSSRELQKLEQIIKKKFQGPKDFINTKLIKASEDRAV
jgi:hypothetical protein